MDLFHKFKEMFSGGYHCPPEDLAAYRRIGEEVYGAEVELSDIKSPRALAYLRAAKCFQVMADALLFDAFSSEGTLLTPVPAMTHELAESWYNRIIELLIGARQEAMFSGGAKVYLPVLLGARVIVGGLCPVPHLTAMRRAAAELDELAQGGLERVRSQPDLFQEVLLKYEEAKGYRQMADAIVGTVMGGQKVPAKTHEIAEQRYWDSLSELLVVIQALEDPTILLTSSNEVLRTRHGLSKSDVWRVTSKLAQAHIRSSGEWDQAERDLKELWGAHHVTEKEQEYERVIEHLLQNGDVREEGYWYCCPFQAVYRVIKGPVNLDQHSIPPSHVFVWDYGEGGVIGRLVTRASFDSADSRHYCED